MVGFKNKVFLLGLADSGYYILRALRKAGVPVVAFECRRNRPEYKTRLCDKKIPFDTEHELLEKLHKMAAQERFKPVLFLSSDLYVDFFLRERKSLEKLFLTNMPHNEIIETLLHKDKFAEYADKNDLIIPKTMIVHTYQDFESSLNALKFPAILKPFNRSPSWKAAGLPKVFCLDDRQSALKIYEQTSAIEDRYILQERIPGPDNNICFCLVYFSSDNECIASFTGHKLRQWPLSLGTTASAKPLEDQAVTETTINFFRDIGYAGFGSVEYKKGKDNKYYIMEPTVGRPNQQSHIMTANGINMPLLAYNHMTGLPLPSCTKADNHVTYVDEYQELASGLTMIINKELTISEWIGSLKGSRTYRFINRDDISPFLYSLPFMFMKFMRRDLNAS